MKLREDYLKKILQSIAEGNSSAERIAASLGLEHVLMDVYASYLADEDYVAGSQAWRDGNLEYKSLKLLPKGRAAVSDLGNWVFQEDAHSTIYDLRGAQFGGGLAADGGFQTGGMFNEYSSKRELSRTERLRLIQTLNALITSQFNELVFALDPPKGILPGNTAPQGERSAALLQWLESPGGPGLAALEEILASLTGPQDQIAAQPAAQSQTIDALLTIIQTLSETTQADKASNTVIHQTFHGSVGNIAGNNYGSMTASITQNNSDISRLLASLREIALTFPAEQKQAAQDYLEDITDDLQQPEKCKPSRVRASIAALLGVAIAIGGAVATATDFANNVLELSEKLSISAVNFEPQLQQLKQVNPDFDWYS